jgi:hypothetical protein
MGSPLSIVDSQPLPQAQPQGGLTITKSEDLPATTRPEGSAGARFASNFWDKTLGALGSLYHSVVESLNSPEGQIALAQGNPAQAALIGLLKNIAAAHVAELQKAHEAYQDGRYSEAAGHAGAALLPILGPAAAQIGEQMGGTPPTLDKYGNVIQQGKEPDVAGALGGAGGLIISVLAPGAVKAGLARAGGDVSVPVPVSSQLNPSEASAVAYASEKGLPVDVATASGNTALKTAKRIISGQPGASDIVRDADLAAQEAYRVHASDIAQGLSPGGATSKIAAGRTVVRGVNDALDSIRAKEGVAWDGLRDMASRITKTVQTGAEPIIGANGEAVTDAAGNPLTKPTTQTLSSPVDMTGVKAAIKPILDRLDKTIPEAQRQASPGYQLVKQIVSSPDQVDLTTALDNLSAVKRIGRGGNELPQVASASQGIAKAITAPFHDAVGSAIEEHLGPEGSDLWNQARQLTTQKQILGKTFTRQQLDNPVGLVRRLTASEDSGVPLLNKIKDAAPDAIPDVARAAFEGMIDKPQAGGGFTRMDGAIAKWNKLGSETKDILYGSRAGDIDKFFQFVKMAQENVNPSGTGPLMWAAHTLETAAHPVTALLRTMGSRQLARVLTAPNGPELLQQGLTVPVGPKAIAAAKAIRAIGIGGNAAGGSPSAQSESQVAGSNP